MKIWDNIYSYIQENNITKALIYRNLGINASSLEYKIKNDSFSIQDYIKICKALEVEPYFFLNPTNKMKYEIKFSENVLKEPEIIYGKNNNDHKQIKPSSDPTIADLLEQNKKLLDIIINLTKK
jgi:hypothetical protein